MKYFYVLVVRFFKGSFGLQYVTKRIRDADSVAAAATLLPSARRIVGQTLGVREGWLVPHCCCYLSRKLRDRVKRVPSSRRTRPVLFSRSNDVPV